MKHRNPPTRFFPLILFAAAFFTAAVLTAPTASAGQTAVCINAAADYSSGTFSVVSADPAGGPRTVQNDINPTVSDLGLNAYGKYFYVIERYFGDNITKYSITDPATPIWQYSVMDGDDTVSSSNPHAIVFAGPGKAYVIRHNTSTAWIVNPKAASQGDFKTGILDLSAYNDQDSFGPEMTNGVVVGNKLFIIMQRLNQDDNWAPNEAYVAVFDTGTDQEINTGKGGSRNGILLPVKGPHSITYEPFSGLIYVGAQGRLASSYSGTAADYSGGIVTINPDTYDTTLVLDDGDDTDHPYGNIYKMAILSQEKGYFIGYAGWGDSTLYTFNPAAGTVSGVTNDSLQNTNISGITAGAYGDKNGLVWVGNQTDAEIVIINPADNSIDETISTNLPPQKIVFVSDDVLRTKVSEDGLFLNWVFEDDMAGYSLLYALSPYTAGDTVYTLDLASLGNPVQLAIPGLPSGFSALAAIQGTTTAGGTVQTSNVETITIP